MAERDIGEMGLDSKYPSNSKMTTGHSSTKPQIEKVVKGNVRIQKKTFGRRFFDSLVTDSEDIKDYILDSVVIPYIKTALKESVDTFLDMLFYGNEGMPQPSGRRNADRVSYRSYSDGSSVRKPRGGYSGQAWEVDSVVLDTHKDANDLLYSLNSMIEEYGEVTVATFYGMIGKSSVYTDNKYGWTSLMQAKVKPTRDGYLLEMPPAKYLNN